MEERIQLEVMGSYGEDGKINIATLKSNLEKNIPESSIGTETKLPLNVEVKGYKFVIKDNGIVEKITSDGSEAINWEEIFADAIGNAEKYLQEASTLGQDIEENKTIGFSENGKVVNMDLWLYEYAVDNYDYYTKGIENNKENGYMLNDGYYDTDGMEYIFYRAGYLGNDLKNIVIPKYIKTISDDEFIPVTSLPYTFYNLSIENMPKIPDTVEDLWDTFRHCTNLKNVTKIPDSVVYMRGTFYECENLVQAPELSTNLREIGGIFGHCKNLNGTIKFTSSNINDMGTENGGYLFNNATLINKIKIQAPAGSTTYNKLIEIYGENTNITIEGI